MRTIMWSFQTKNLRVTASVETSAYVDVSFDESGETAAKIDSGEWTVFDTTVVVYYRGTKIGDDSLCQSIYANPAEFFRDHRDPDWTNRNCSRMRAAKGDNVVIGHYFPDMVRIVLREARDNLFQLQAVRLRTNSKFGPATVPIDDHADSEDSDAF
jgi:hypothetical protein